MDKYELIANSTEFKKMEQAEMKVIIEILKIENDIYWNEERNYNSSQSKSMLEKVEDEAYKLNLDMLKILIDNNAVLGSKHGATLAFVNNFFYRYGLSYPQNWEQHDPTNGKAEYTYTYDSDDLIEAKNTAFMGKVDQLFAQRRVDEFTHERLVRMTDYMKQYRTSLCHHSLGITDSKQAQ